MRRPLPLTHYVLDSVPGNRYLPKKTDGAGFLWSVRAFSRVERAVDNVINSTKQPSIEIDRNGVRIVLCMNIVHEYTFRLFSRLLIKFSRCPLCDKIYPICLLRTTFNNGTSIEIV